MVWLREQKEGEKSIPGGALLRLTNYCKVKGRECVGDRATIHLGLTEAIPFSSCKFEFSVAKVEVLTCKII